MQGVARSLARTPEYYVHGAYKYEYKYTGALAGGLHRPPLHPSNAPSCLPLRVGWLQPAQIDELDDTVCLAFRFPPREQQPCFLLLLHH